MRRRLALIVLPVLLAAAGCGTSTAPFTRPATGPLCGFRDGPPQTYEHVVWLLRENTSERDVIGAADLPFINNTLVKQCGLATNFHSVSHASLPNYLALSSGSSGGSREADNCQPLDCPRSQPNLFEQVQDAGLTWGSTRGQCQRTAAR